MKKITQLCAIIFILCIQKKLFAQTIYYVNINATGATENGSSWANAFTNLQPALDAAVAGDQVWVATGTYLPTESPDETITDDRNKAFHFNIDIKVYGGFAGTETTIDERITGNETILSGDLGVVDDISDDAYHVLIIIGLSYNTLIDGFTVTKGNANGSSSITYTSHTYDQENGGGISNYNSSPTITNTNFTNNTAINDGGGMYNNYRCSPKITGINFINNTAESGGGMYNSSISYPKITNTNFINNMALKGGGIYNYSVGASARITNTNFTDNTAINGGGIYNRYSQPRIINTNFINNSATGNGGGMYNYFLSDVRITNSIFWNNTASLVIDDIYNSTSIPTSPSIPTGDNNASDASNTPNTTVILSTDKNPPLFTNEANEDFTLQLNSPLINAGLNSINTETLDLAGNERIYDTTIDIGAYEAITLTWTGTTSNDWNTATNWNLNTVPTTTSRVTIPNNVINYPTTNSAITINTIKIEDGATFIAESTVTGEVTYKRNVPSTDWHLVSSPVNGETIEDIIANNSLATGTNTNLGLAPFNNSGTTPWDYQTATSSGSLNSGQGYSIKLDAAAEVSFTGTANTSNVTYPVLPGDRNNFFLIGNPFTAYINSATSVSNSNNQVILSEETVWLWDGTQYVVHNATNPIEIAPAQGFFVDVNPTLLSGGNYEFRLSERSHQATDTFQKGEPTSNFELLVENGNAQSTTKVFYVDGKTTGFDNGYDSKMFGGVAYDFAVFTELITENTGNKLAIQTLPIDNVLAIPVGLIAKAGEELTFSLNNINLTDNQNVYLEDTLTNELIDLSKTSYKISLEEDINGVGRFYLQSTAKSLSTEEITENLNNVSIYKSSNQEITISGLSTDASVSIFSLLGKEVMHTNITSNGVSKISLPTVSAGVYIVKLNSKYGETTKKITLN